MVEPPAAQEGGRLPPPKPPPGRAGLASSPPDWCRCTETIAGGDVFAVLFHARQTVVGSCRAEWRVKLHMFGDMGLRMIT